VDGAEEAASAAAELGWPVVVKRDGPAHKSRAGGVVLGLRSPAEAGDAAASLGGRVLVARQVESGEEVLCGMTRDPDYGPILAVGTGGGAVEELDRVALAVAPLDLESARNLVEEERIADPEGVVAQTLVALSQLALAYPVVESVDVNPLIVGPAGTVAVDALVVVSARGGDESR
jgi:acetyltransferase